MEGEKESREGPVLKRELETVKSSLRHELIDTAVMVPATTRAFFAGTLQPTVKEDKEQVLVKMVGDNLVELDRSQAVDYLDRRIESLAASTTRASMAAGERSSEDAETPSLPFFEIREELDESGREIKSEAINVAKQLEYLQKKNGKQTLTDRPIVPTASEEPTALDKEPEEHKQVTDTEYESLSNRLDVLARLEEEAEANKVVNQKSSKQLQSKGWSKGFLNAKPKKKKMAPGQKKGALSESSIPSAAASEGRKVGFQTADEVREIPRIGERSASELKQPMPVAGRKEIEPQVFSGIVRERSVGSDAANSPSTKAPPRKKLSKFAQERLAEQQR